MDARTVYARSRTVFPRAVFYKPDESQVEPLRPEMTPLIVQQAGGGSASAWEMSGLGLVYADPRGTLRVDASQPVVYAKIGTGFVGGAVRAQTMLAWCQEVALYAERHEVICRGLRVTHDAEGYPLAWEVIDPKARGWVIYVSETVESAAQSSYGKPAPGRRHSVERGVEDKLAAVVPRVLSDGPIPMGPFVYIDAARGDVLAVLCRCMASQVDSFTETRVYRVLPFAELGPLGVALAAGKSALTSKLRWPDGLE